MFEKGAEQGAYSPISIKFSIICDTVRLNMPLSDANTRYLCLKLPDLDCFGDLSKQMA